MQYVIRAAITAVFLLAFSLRTAMPDTFSRMDVVSVALLAVAAIPWISEFVGKLSIPGVFEAELRDLRRQLDDTSKQAATAAATAHQAEQNSETLFLASRNTPSASKNPEEKLVQLADNYIRDRGSMKSGQPRTMRMTTIFREMVAEAEALGATWPAAREWLKSPDGGKNLAAVAHAFTFPESMPANALLACLENSTQPFVQYWALRALQVSIEELELRQFSAADIERMRSIVANLPENTDRHYLATTINSAIDRLLG
ncbi:MAG: hypothetical protein EON58_12290 [Alphaproteobacteria bacterium]|nr:MAG: hypothetical protein EON58_12290 [Alphaproteobacteria bacterium]